MMTDKETIEFLNKQINLSIKLLWAAGYLIVVLGIGTGILGHSLHYANNENERLSEMLEARSITKSVIERTVGITVENQWYKRCGLANTPDIERRGLENEGTE